MDKWTGELIGNMHNNHITIEDVANKMGYSKAYVSMILNCKRKPPNIEIKMKAAVDDLIAEKRETRKEDENET